MWLNLPVSSASWPLSMNDLPLKTGDVRLSFKTWHAHQPATVFGSRKKPKLGSYVSSDSACNPSLVSVIANYPVYIASVEMDEGSNCQTLSPTDEDFLLFFWTVLAQLNYCNFLLAGCPLYQIDSLQNFQNSAAEFVLCERGTPFHWLPMRARIASWLRILYCLVRLSIFLTSVLLISQIKE